LRNKRRVGREDTSLNDVDIEPAIAVEIEQPNATRGRLGELTLGRASVVEGEDQAGVDRVVVESRRDVHDSRRARQDFVRGGLEFGIDIGK
jgi:hypothetical protein